MRLYSSGIGLVVAVAAATLVASLQFVPRRGTPGAPHGMTRDQISYIAAAENRLEVVNEPYRYRVLLPMAARASPIPPELALRSVNYALFLVVPALYYLTAVAFGLGAVASAASAAMFAVAGIRIEENPHMTDLAAMGLASLQILLARQAQMPASAGNAGRLTLAFVVSALNRELSAVNALSLLRSRPRFAMIACVLSITAAVVVRIALAPHPDLRTSLDQAIQSSPLFRLELGAFAIGVVNGFGVLWVPATVGAVIMVRRERSRWLAIRPWILVLGATTIASCVMASDISRMVSIGLSPIIALCVAQRCEAVLGDEDGGRGYLTILALGVLTVAAASVVSWRLDVGFGLVRVVAMLAVAAAEVTRTFGPSRAARGTTLRGS